MLTRNARIAPLLAILEQHGPLGSADAEAILSLPYTVREYPARSRIIREQELMNSCLLLFSGFAYEHTLLRGGQRQITAMYVPGEVIGLQVARLSSVDREVDALARTTAAVISLDDIGHLAETRPRIARALWSQTLFELRHCRRWLATIGRAEGRARVLHLLCELGLRYERAGLGKRQHFELPMTQEQIGEATGLTAVHVNRVLQSLRYDGVVEREQRFVIIKDWDLAADLAGLTGAHTRSFAPKLAVGF